MITTLRATARAALLAFFAFSATSTASAEKSGHANHGAAAKEAAMKGGTATIGDLVIDAAWTRQTPPGAKVAGAYLSVTNNGSEPDRLIGGKADFAGRVEIHEMSVTDGVMRMAELKDGLEIAPGETAVLEPGSFHIMFMDISASPKKGETVPVTLSFAKAGEVTVMMPVAAIGASKPGNEGSKEGMDHSKMGHRTRKEPSN